MMSRRVQKSCSILVSAGLFITAMCLGFVLYVPYIKQPYNSEAVLNYFNTISLWLILCTLRIIPAETASGYCKTNNSLCFFLCMFFPLAGYSVLVVGVADVDMTELRSIASKPSERHVFVVDSYDAFSKIQDNLITVICETVTSSKPAIIISVTNNYYSLMLYCTSWGKHFVDLSCLQRMINAFADVSPPDVLLEEVYKER